MTDSPPDDTKDTGWRGSRELWLSAALSAFLEGGVDAVKIQPLASRLNLSRTSFYWFFENRQDLLKALLDQWDAQNTAVLVEATQAYAETPTEAVLNVTYCFLEQKAFDPKLEFAIRGWALQSDDVMARVIKTDEIRLKALTALLQKFGFDDEDADVRARTIYLVQIGYISMQVREDLDLRLSRVPGYVRTFCGREPSSSEFARFKARFRPQSD
ncbi:TetR/AcrR family transcriptional regulator [Roseibium algae]|uniref:TetR/AcrR family transcriptional regulator n=1 Tax=Roseibium algae TaxID=3123038 RepID=A0ABU8TIM7_9HYPH